jgi:hypothetical protein
MASIAGGWGVWGCLAVASWCGKTDGEGTDSRGCCTMASIAGMLMPMWGCLTVGSWCCKTVVEITPVLQCQKCVIGCYGVVRVPIDTTQLQIWALIAAIKSLFR